MVAVKHLIGPAALPSISQHYPNSKQLSVLSYNVLLPNSLDGWWNYKMYLPPLSPANQFKSSWDYRSNLLKERIGQIDADVVCLQEVSPKSFEDDFSFMEELGYDGVEMFKKGRFRPATFWKTNKLQLAAPPVHKDRTLLTAFSLKDQESKEKKDGDSSISDDERHWFCLNCHLQAGKEGGRRVRQINEGVRAAMTLSRKLKEKEPEENIRLIVCGDFNGGPECGAVRYLEDGAVDPEFLEDGDRVTSKKKTLPLATTLIDVPKTVDRYGSEPPATLIVPELISTMVKEGTIDTPELSQIMVESLTRIYNRFATHESENGKEMCLGDVEKWLIATNGQVGRGSEFRTAAREMGWTEPPEPEQSAENSESAENRAKQPQKAETFEEKKARIFLPPDGILTLEGLCRVYADELRQGKFWGIAYDLAVLGEPLPDVGMFTARYDRMYCSTSVLPTAVLDTICTDPCPNEVEASDHLPVAATFVAKADT